MSNSNLVSIIIPIYNVESYLDRCINSIINQTYNNIEIILVDDGSTDNSGNIADQYAQNYDYITVIHQINNGLSNARNIGLENAKGEWIIFVDSDDYVDKNYISKLINDAIDKDADISTCNCQKVDEKNNQLNDIYDWPDTVLSGKEAIEYRFKKAYGSHIWLCLFKTSIFKENRIKFPEGREYESFAVIIQALYYARRVAFTNDKLYYYVSRNDSITHKTISRKTFNDKIAAMKDLHDFNSNEANNEIKKYLDYYSFVVINGILNDISKIKTKRNEMSQIWKEARRILLHLYPKTTFPSFEIKIKRGIMLIISIHQSTYCTIYNKIA